MYATEEKIVVKNRTLLHTQEMHIAHKYKYNVYYKVYKNNLNNNLGLSLWTALNKILGLHL